MLKNFSLALVALVLTAGWALASDELSLDNVDFSTASVAEVSNLDAAVELDLNGQAIKAEDKTDEIVDACYRGYYGGYGGYCGYSSYCYSPSYYSCYTPCYSYCYQPVVCYRPVVYSYCYTPCYTSCYSLNYWGCY